MDHQRCVQCCLPAVHQLASRWYCDSHPLIQCTLKEQVTTLQLLGHNTVVINNEWHDVDWWEIEAGKLILVTERNDEFHLMIEPRDLDYIALE